MDTKTITLTTTDWTNIEYKNTRDWSWFSLWTDADVQFAEIQNPSTSEQVPLASNTRVVFRKPATFYIKWNIWDNIYLAPFEK